MKMRELTRITVLIPGILIGIISFVYLLNRMTEQTVFTVFIPGIAVCLMSIGVYFSFGYSEGNAYGDIKSGLKSAWLQDESDDTETET